MTDSKYEKCSKMVCTLCRFTKLYSIELGAHITVGQLYRGLGLHTFGYDQQDLVQLSLAVDRRGKSRGLAFLRIPIMLEKHVLGFDGCLLEGKRLRFTQVKLRGASRLKTIGWVRDYKIDPAVTLCHNRPLHFCHQPSTDPESDEEGSEPVFDVGARLFHGSLKGDLDTVLAKAYERGIRKINIPCYNVEQCEKAINLVHLYKGRIDIYFSAGIGPSCVNIWSEMSQTRLESMYKMDACSSVGLIGLDFRPETLRCTRKDKQLKVFEEQFILGAWLSLNGEAIYGTKAWTAQNDTKTPNVWYTSKKTSDPGLVVYAIVLQWPDPGELYLDSATPTPDTTVTLLGYAPPISWRLSGTDHGIKLVILTIPFNKMPCKYAWVFKMTNLA